MPKFSKTGTNLLSKCHPDIQIVLYRAIENIDFTILPSTIRTVEEQKEFVASGKSKTMNSKHLPRLYGYSYAVDLWKYPIVWSDESGQTELARYILGIADTLYHQRDITHKFKWGGDFKSNFGFNRNGDLPHFELEE